MPPARRPRVVLDTNVVFSGIVSRSGPPFEILYRWHARAFTLLMNESINREYHRIISQAYARRNVRLDGFDADLFLGLLTVDAVWIESDAAPMVRTRDRSDDELLAVAIGGHADFLVTGDNDLLVHTGDPRIGSLEIVRPAPFLRELLKCG